MKKLCRQVSQCKSPGMAETAGLADSFPGHGFKIGLNGMGDPQNSWFIMENQ